MNIVFFGSDNFAATHLTALLSSRHRLLGCVTQPDRPRGRGMKISISPVKEVAAAAGIKLLQPDDLSNDSIFTMLKEMGADLFIVVAYGKILPKKILDIPHICSINVHASLLPKYRGAAPINWAIINGEKKTGISIIKMNEQMDAGDILCQKEIDILPEEDAVSLKNRLSHIGAELLIETIDLLQKERDLNINNMDVELLKTARAQDPALVTYAPKLTKELGRIDWGKSACYIHNLVRGLLPWPCAYTYYNDRQMKILLSEIVGVDEFNYQPGEVAMINREGIVVSTGKGGLLVKKLHLSSSKAMDAYSFVIGHKIKPGFIFGI